MKIYVETRSGQDDEIRDLLADFFGDRVSIDVARQEEGSVGEPYDALIIPYFDATRGAGGYPAEIKHDRTHLVAFCGDDASRDRAAKSPSVTLALTLDDLTSSERLSLLGEALGIAMIKN